MNKLIVTSGEININRNDFAFITQIVKNDFGNNIQKYLSDNNISAELIIINSGDNYAKYIEYIKENIFNIDCIIDAFKSNVSDDITLIKVLNPDCKIISVKNNKHNDISIIDNTLIDSVGNKMICDDIYAELLKLVNNDLKLKW
jgi:hypothetical protein